jgi:hypothetical protein
MRRDTQVYVRVTGHKSVETGELTITYIFCAKAVSLDYITALPVNLFYSVIRLLGSHGNT